MSFSIVPMRSDHLAEMANVHLAAFQDSFLSRMGQRFLMEYYRCYLDRGRALAYVALGGQRGDVVGFVVGAEDIGAFYAEAFSRRFWRLAWAAIVSSLGSPVLLVEVWKRRGAIAGPLFGRLLKRKPAGATLDLPPASLTSIGVTPAARRRGVAKALMGAFLAELTRRDIPAAKLGVLADNDGACTFYERHGWVCAREYRGHSGRAGRTYVYRVRPPGPVPRERGSLPPDHE
jgi:ribosomal protein S18 acetylase RimI-like enzyme